MGQRSQEKSKVLMYIFCLASRWWLREKMQKRNGRLQCSWDGGTPWNLIWGGLPDGGSFLNMLLYAKGKTLKTSLNSPEQEAWGLFLTIHIQRELKHAIPQHLSFFIWKMEILVARVADSAPVPISFQDAFLYFWKWKTDSSDSFAARLQACGLVSTDPLPSLGTQMWKWAVQEVAPGWETGKHRDRASGERGRNFSHSVPNTMSGHWQVSARASC